MVLTFLDSDYHARAAEHARRADEERRRSAGYSRARLATFLPGAAALLWALGHGADPTWLGVGLMLLAGFAVLVFRHAKIEELVRWYDALRLFNLRALARIDRRWDDLPSAAPPLSTDLTHHPYALDLDLFGRASLFQWLGPAATSGGAVKLAQWLLAPAEASEIATRQAAVDELAREGEFREALAAHGILAADARQAEVDAFVRWAEDRQPAMPAWVRPVVLVLTAAIWILLVLLMTGVLGGSYFMIPVVIGLVLSFGLGKPVELAFERAGAGQDALRRYAGLLEHATGKPFASEMLRRLAGRLSADGRSAPACMRRFNNILGFAMLRYSAALLHFPIQALTLWDFHVLFALDRWRAHTGSHVREWFDALAELDALSLFAGIRRDNPSWSMPELADRPLFTAKELGHPLIRDDRRVANDVELGPAGTILLVTGSNMSGKSTLLRSIGLNTVLAQAGSCVCATSLRLPASDLQTSIRVQDSLELGLSYFMAALARLKGVVDAAERHQPGRVLLYLLDEILQGTNSAERGIAVRGVARHLLDADAIGAMTTHDLALAGEEPLRSSARLVHFTEVVDESGEMRFDYRLREGLATSRNALRLMRLIGIDL